MRIEPTALFRLPVRRNVLHQLCAATNSPLSCKSPAPCSYVFHSSVNLHGRASGGCCSAFPLPQTFCFCNLTCLPAPVAGPMVLCGGELPRSLASAIQPLSHNKSHTRSAACFLSERHLLQATVGRVPEVHKGVRRGAYAAPWEGPPHHPFFADRRLTGLTCQSPSAASVCCVRKRSAAAVASALAQRLF